MNTIRSSNAVPSGEHWVILESRTSTIPGDARSIPAPGHGYPEHTEQSVVYHAYDTEEDMQRSLSDLTALPHNSDRYVGLHVSAVYRAKTHVVVERRKER